MSDNMTDADMSGPRPRIAGTIRPSFQIDDTDGQLGEGGSVYLTMHYGTEHEELGQYDHIEEAVIALKAVKVALSVVLSAKAPTYGGWEIAGSFGTPAPAGDNWGKYVSAPSYDGVGEPSAGSSLPSHLDDHTPEPHPIADSSFASLDSAANAASAKWYERMTPTQRIRYEEGIKAFGYHQNFGIDTSIWEYGVTGLIPGAVDLYLNEQLTIDELKVIYQREDAKRWTRVDEWLGVTAQADPQG